MNVTSRKTASTGAAPSTMVRRVGETVQTIAVSLTGTGAVSATVVLEGYDPNSGIWFPLLTLTLSGTNSAAECATGVSAFLEFRDNVTALSGTSAVATVSLFGA